MPKTETATEEKVVKTKKKARKKPKEKRLSLISKVTVNR